MNKNEIYGLLLNHTIQFVELYGSLILEPFLLTENKIHQENSSTITIKKSGIYVINAIIYLQNYGEIAIFINNKMIEKPINKSNLVTNIVLLYEIVFLQENDIVELKNVSQNLIIIFNPNHKTKTNIEFVIRKINNLSST
jgi:hypothetical protein